MGNRYHLIALAILLNCAWAALTHSEHVSTALCIAEGSKCTSGRCCPGSTCILNRLSLSGVCKKAPKKCSLTGKKCDDKVPCCNIRDLCKAQKYWPLPRVCTTQSCAPSKGQCLTRTPFYTGPEFPCCDPNDACLFPEVVSGRISGICLPKSNDSKCIQEGAQCSAKIRKPCCKGLECDVSAGPLSLGFCRKPKTCLASGKPCTEETANSCCPSLKCTIVTQGVAPPDGIFKRICFDQNCSTNDCSKGQLCCPGWGCSSFNGKKTCVPPPSAGPPRSLQ